MIMPMDPDSDVNAHDQVIRDTLQSAYTRGGDRIAVDNHTPRDALEELEEMRESAAAVELDCYRRLMGFFFADGPHPAKVVRRVYACAKAFNPELCAHMTCQELATLLGETRAAVSWRIKAVVNHFCEARGVKALRASFQRSDESCAKYAAAARGNKSRRIGSKKKKNKA